MRQEAVQRLGYSSEADSTLDLPETFCSDACNRANRKE